MKNVFIFDKSHHIAKLDEFLRFCEENRYRCFVDELGGTASFEHDVYLDQRPIRHPGLKGISDIVQLMMSEFINNHLPYIQAPSVTEEISMILFNGNVDVTATEWLMCLPVWDEISVTIQSQLQGIVLTNAWRQFEFFDEGNIFVLAMGEDFRVVQYQNQQAMADEDEATGCIGKISIAPLVAYLHHSRTNLNSPFHTALEICTVTDLIASVIAKKYPSISIHAQYEQERQLTFAGFNLQQCELPVQVDFFLKQHLQPNCLYEIVITADNFLVLYRREDPDFLLKQQLQAIVNCYEEGGYVPDSERKLLEQNRHLIDWSIPL